MTKPAALSKCYADKIIQRPMDFFKFSWSWSDVNKDYATFVLNASLSQLLLNVINGMIDRAGAL